ncbi:MAG: two-component regulator propeller domain-containing protein [Bacteroidales bacterium]|nr:two-component regulator propeller domain-containing protein [Bacteroidales bacterium]
MKKTILLLLSYISLTVSAQLPSGTWRTHLSYSSVTQVAETPTKVFGLADGALFAYNKATQNINLYSKVDGLSDNKVTLIAYSSTNSTLMIVYDNSNIDLLTEDGHIYNIPDIKDNQKPFNKTINKVNFEGSIAYVGTYYGITTINLTTRLAENTYLLKKKVLSTATFNGNIYAATDQGIVSASLSSNLADNNNWTLINALKATDLAVFQNTLVGVVTSSGLYSITPSSYQLLKTNTAFTNLFVVNNVLIVFGLKQLSYFTSLAQETIVSGTTYYGLSALDPTITTWHAAGTAGINRIDKSGSSYTKVTLGYKPTGPMANNPYRMKFSGNKLMVVGGGAYYDRYKTPGQMMFFNNEQWSFQKVDTILAQGATARDFMNIVEDPRETNHYFVSSYGEGVYEFRNQKLVKIHDHFNSSIQAHALVGTASHYDRTFGLCYDKDTNLYVTNMHVSNAVKVFSKNGTWTSLNYPLIANKELLFEIGQTKKGLFWVISVEVETGVFFFDTKGTLTNQSDDQSKFFSTIDYLENGEQKSLKPANFLCLAEDKKGELWVGTDKGPVIFKNPSQIFDANYMESRIKLPATAASPITGYLLEGDNVTSIAVDANNRKWLGTDANGVYFVSEDGLQTIFHYSTDNSPLPSNKILSIAIHPTTGEVFIGTDKGLVSYTNEALTSQKKFTEVYATPNPVRPEYDGSITISGLKLNSSVKITDASGKTVFEGTSTETQIVWDGLDKSGNRVDTGVYSVYASTSDSLESFVTQIVVVK